MDLKRAILLSAIALVGCSHESQRRAPTEAATPATAAASSSTAVDAGVDAEALPSPSIASIDDAVSAAIAKREVRGAVVEVTSGDEIIHRRAYGSRRVVPIEDAMKIDTVFDLASLTKPLATALSIHLLAERKKLHLADVASRFLPELEGDAKKITIEELLLHTSGLPADDALSDYAKGPAEALRKMGAAKLANPPGSKMLYSDVGYILLGVIVERASGEKLDAFVKKNLYAPLSLADTMFLPTPELSARAAPTSPRDGKMLEGDVHDPRAHLLGGVAGHAGLFSTADDVTRLARMILHGGEPDGAHVLAASTVDAMVAPHAVPGGERALGWDVHRGLSGKPGIGHTGFTGTSLWIDFATRTTVVILTSRLHPDEKGDVAPLRKAVHAAVVKELADRPARGKKTKLGIDVLEERGFAGLVGKKVGVVANDASRDGKGVRTLDALLAGGVVLGAIFSPEHGLDAKGEGTIANGKDAKTGAPVISLYGSHRSPSDSDLAGLDAIVFDLQDAGVRFYTFETTLGLVLEAAKKKGVKVVVLDRPNPIGGAIQGPLLDSGKESFVAYHTIPIRHGMTTGELAKLFDREKGIGVDLEVIAMQGYRRTNLWDDTGLTWVPPSPNLRTATENILYPGVALVEATNVSVGRGTDTPFEVVGAPWLDGEALAKELADQRGLTVMATRFTPSSPPFKGEACTGVRFAIDAVRAVDSLRLGVAIAVALKKLAPSKWERKNLGTLIGNRATVDAIERGDSVDSIVGSWASDEAAFEKRRAAVALY